MAQLLNALWTGVFGAAAPPATAGDASPAEPPSDSAAAAAAAAAAEPLEAPAEEPAAVSTSTTASVEDLVLAASDDDDSDAGEWAWASAFRGSVVDFDELAEEREIAELMAIGRRTVRPPTSVFLASRRCESNDSDSDGDGTVWAFVFEDDSDDEFAVDAPHTAAVVPVAAEAREDVRNTYRRPIAQYAPVEEPAFWPESYLDVLEGGAYRMFADVHTCPNCCEERLARQMVRAHTGCSYKTCCICVGAYAHSALSDGVARSGRIKCMQWNCPTDANNPWDKRLPLDQCTGPDLHVYRQCLDPATFQSLSEATSLLAIRVDPHMATCPNPKCATPFFTESATCKDVRCPACTRGFCRDCHGPWHAHVGSCALYQKFSYDQEWAGQGELHDWQLDLRRNVDDAKQCPTCRQRILKNGGCDHMYCTWCGLDFCWICEKSYADNHNPEACSKRASRSADEKETARLRRQFRELRALEAQRWRSEAPAASEHLSATVQQEASAARQARAVDSSTAATSRSAAAAAGDSDIDVDWDDEFESLAGVRVGKHHPKKSKSSKRWHSSRRAVQRTRDRRFSRGLKEVQRTSGSAGAAAGLKVRKQAAVLAA